jgi:hypothetical protein
MAKRQREGDILFERKRPCVLNNVLSHCSVVNPVSLVGVKRSAETECVVDYKRQRSKSESPLFNDCGRAHVVPSSMGEEESKCRKRAAEFDSEVHHMHKRLKATTPTAEEVMAFVLPHLITMRKMHVSSLQHCRVLQKHNQTLANAYNQLLEQATSVTRRMRRELEMSKYQMMLMSTRK